MTNALLEKIIVSECAFKDPLAQNLTDTSVSGPQVCEDVSINSANNLADTPVKISNVSDYKSLFFNFKELFDSKDYAGAVMLVKESPELLGYMIIDRIDSYYSKFYSDFVGDAAPYFLASVQTTILKSRPKLSKAAGRRIFSESIIQIEQEYGCKNTSAVKLDAHSAVKSDANSAADSAIIFLRLLSTKKPKCSAAFEIFKKNPGLVYCLSVMAFIESSNQLDSSNICEKTSLYSAPVKMLLEYIPHIEDMREKTLPEYRRE